MGRIFGTDGVRGAANTILTPELAFNLGRAGAYVLAQRVTAADSLAILVGRDTRISGDMLQAAMVAGILSVGADACLAGVLPTPAVAHLTATQGVHAGVMISASHNPAEDNGIKFFSRDGYKLPDELEDEIEYYLDHPASLPRPAGDRVGRVRLVEDWQQRYLDYLLQYRDFSLDGLHVVLDCANGAAYRLAAQLFAATGAVVTTINDSPDGTNINVNCGSTRPAGLAKAVVELGADLGFAFDGDADRLIAVDHLGQTVDGDAIMAICALDLKRRGLLSSDLLVATVMSNLGLEKAMQAAGIRLLRSQVGDRYVLAMMQETGAALGGEQSGHIIFSQLSTTGDGLLTALQLAGIVAGSSQSLAELAAVIQPYPQVLHNVRVADKGIVDLPPVQAAIEQAKAALDGRGRILVRPSGTEPLIRVMVEAEEQALADAVAMDVVRALESAR